MSVRLDVEKLAEFLDIDKVSIDAHADAKRCVHFEGQLNLPNGSMGLVRRCTVKGLRLGSVMRGHSQRMREVLMVLSSPGGTYAEEVPAVGYLRWPIPRFPGKR